MTPTQAPTTVSLSHPLEQGAHFTAFDSGPLTDWADHSITIPGLGTVAGKLFLQDILNLTSCEISINAMPAGGAMPFFHTHQQHEEIYVFVSGQGELIVDDTTLAVGPGSVVRIDPAGERTWRNTGTTPLVYLVIQAPANTITQSQGEDGQVTERPIPWQ